MKKKEEEKKDEEQKEEDKNEEEKRQKMNKTIIKTKSQRICLHKITKMFPIIFGKNILKN